MKVRQITKGFEWTVIGTGTLTIDVPPEMYGLKLVCRNCGRVFRVMGSASIRCPHCGSPDCVLADDILEAMETKTVVFAEFLEFDDLRGGEGEG